MKRGVLQVRLGREDRGIEALEVAHLQDAPLRGGTRDQRARLLGRLGDGFLDQHVRAGARNASAISKCAGVGVTTLTASTLPSSSR